LVGVEFVSPPPPLVSGGEVCAGGLLVRGAAGVEIVGAGVAGVAGRAEDVGGVFDGTWTFGSRPVLAVPDSVGAVSGGAVVLDVGGGAVVAGGVCATWAFVVVGGAVGSLRSAA
jgi:hypothetical protein